MLISFSCSYAFSQITRLDQGGTEFSKLSMLGVDYLRVIQNEDGGFLLMFLYKANVDESGWGFLEINSAADFEELYTHIVDGFARDRRTQTPIFLEMNNNLVELEFASGIGKKYLTIAVSDLNNRNFIKRSHPLSFKEVKKIFKKED